MQSIDREITTAVDLCDAAGNLNPEAIGWSRHPLHRGNLKGRWLRKKKWDYWCIVGPNFLFSATLAHVDYFGLAAVYLLEYESKRFARAGALAPFGKKPFMHPKLGAPISFNKRRFHLNFIPTDKGLSIQFQLARFQGRPLSGEIAITRPQTHESLNVVVPWDERTFQFTSKQHALAAQGVLNWGDEELRFEPDTSFATLDFGRGVWPYRTTWNWGAFSGWVGEDLLGVNLGGQWTDGTGMNENGIICNGRLHKIFDDVQFDYDRQDFMKPWRIHSKESDAVDLCFTPFYDRADTINLAVIRAAGHQVFGHYSGTISFDGRRVEIPQLIGWAEEHDARW